ncbi:MAG: sigma 54-interacting transcriptional regulator [candidate division Zixibacteria bacterium]|nr:sigma 54-interacting transcriptional regulator [candidate division Zixibacteria bacterium]
MNLTISQLNDAELLIFNKQFSKALEILHGIASVSPSDEEEAFINLLFIEASLPLGYYNIIEKLRFAINYYKRSINHDKYARIKSCHGLYLSSLGKFTEAKEAYFASLISYKRIDNIEGQQAVLNRLAFVFNHVGDIQKSIDYLSQCMSLIDCNDAKRKATIMVNISLQYRKIGSICKSIECYNQIDKEHISSDDKVMAVFYTMSSIPHAMLDDFIVAKNTISKAKPFLKDYIREQAIYYETLGWIHNLEGKYNFALTELTKGLKIAEDIAPKSALMSQIKRRMADSYLGLKDYKSAEQFAGEALTVAEKLNERVEIAECWRIQAQIANYHSESDKAKKHFKKAIDMFNMIGTKYNLAACRYLAATSGLYHNGERQAMLYLAREYFTSEDVKHYVDKIEKQLHRRGLPAHPSHGVPHKEHICIASSPAMIKLIEMADNIAPSSMSILLTGDTGTGKDHLARYLHEMSGLPGEFVSINISAIPNEMIEAELFGHCKGAFTGALSDRVGLIEQASGGTLFLNEIADATPQMQAKLLEALENQTFRRLGENKTRQVSFRLLTATNKDLEEQVKSNRFRADLYHRIKQVEIHLPPLSARQADIGPLIEHFLKLHKVKTDKTSIAKIASAFKLRTWPGNVRELQTELSKLCALHQHDIVKIAEAAANDSLPESEQLLSLLEKHNWNRSKVARELGIGESTVRSKIKKHRLTQNSHLREN